MSFSITLYRNSAEPNRVDKSSYLTEVQTISGVLREETSILAPILTLELSTRPNANYCYIPQFNRYYYITDIVSVRNNLWEISLSVDVLMSHKAQLLNCVAFIDRNEDYFAPNSIDNERVVRQGTRTSEVYGSGLGFPNILMRNIEGETFQTEMCVVLNGYKLEAVGRTE